MKYQAMGVAIKRESSTSATNSFDRSAQRLSIEAPNTFRIPTSRVRCSARKEARPNNPRQEIRMASSENDVASFPIRSSLRNFLPYSSSLKLYIKGLDGLYFLSTASVFASEAFRGRLGFMRIVMVPRYPPPPQKNTDGSAAS